MPADVSTLLGGRYELQDRVGAGGFSEVWRAHDRVLERPVAIKLLDDKYARDPEALARFRAEAHNAGCLSHGNIARVYDFGEPDPPFPAYLAMELVDGPALSDILERGPIDAAWCMDVIAQVAAGLHEAHQRGLVHRDVKPANLLVSGDVVKVADFGISHAVDSASLTMTGVVIGSPGYVAPERASGASATPASDLYALGVVAYECLVGAPPFSGTGLEVALAHVNQPFPELPDHVPAEVAAFVVQLTKKDPALRPADAAAVARTAARLRDALLAASATAAPAKAVPGPAAAMTARRPSLTTGRIGLAGAAAACLLVGLVLVSMLSSAPTLPTASHRPTRTNDSSQLSRKAAAVSSVVVRSRSLAGLAVEMVVRQLHQLGLATRVVLRPTSAQPPGTVVAVYPAGRHRSGSQITIVAAVRPPRAGPPAHKQPAAHRMPGTSGGQRCEVGHGPGDHRGEGPEGSGPGSGRCVSGSGSSGGSGRPGG